MGKMTNSQPDVNQSWQRRMGVEPTGDRAERPPSRFEDGETHRSPYTSMLVYGVFCHWGAGLSSKLADGGKMYLGEVLHHQICDPQAGQVALARDRNAIHLTRAGRCNACYCVFYDQAV